MFGRRPENERNPELVILGGICNDLDAVEQMAEQADDFDQDDDAAGNPPQPEMLPNPVVAVGDDEREQLRDALAANRHIAIPQHPFHLFGRFGLVQFHFQYGPLARSVAI